MNQVVRKAYAKDGRELTITDDPELFEQLQSEGQIVFTSTEMAIVRQSRLKPEQTSIFLTVKEVFGGTVSHIGPPLGIDTSQENSREFWKKRAKRKVIA